MFGYDDRASSTLINSVYTPEITLDYDPLLLPDFQKKISSEQWAKRLENMHDHYDTTQHIVQWVSRSTSHKLPSFLFLVIFVLSLLQMLWSMEFRHRKPIWERESLRICDELTLFAIIKESPDRITTVDYAAAGQLQSPCLRSWLVLQAWRWGKTNSDGST